MDVNIINLRKSINKAYLKVRPNRSQIETFKKNILRLFDRIDESESEEFHKNITSDFFKNTWYYPDYFINTKGRADLVIHTGKDTTAPVGVLFEVKKSGNRTEMPTTGDLNSKAFHELMLYYLRERVKEKNISIKYLVITNIYEWFIFQSADFEKLIAGNKKLVEQFSDFEEGRLGGSTTDFFYKYVAEPFCSGLEAQIPVTYFDIRDFENVIRNGDRTDDTRLIGLYKIFSPEHLLKLPFANDSNSLDKGFYSELLHIIGLEEIKEGSKKVICRKKEDKRNDGSIIENIITILKAEDCLTGIQKREVFGNTPDEQLFNIAMELAITWINRIIFLKLLESQLVKYNGGDKNFRFLNSDRINDYDELNKLFFQVLAVKEQERSGGVREKFSGIPFLNSSLFEPSDLEHKTIRINSLEDSLTIPVLNNTVLRDTTGRKVTGEMVTLRYLFAFLDAYDFSGEGSEDIQEENKTLINASVLGLMFEKINGYRDGSFFTPGFITMYMCNETIRRAVVQKFNDAKGWKCETINDVYNNITDIAEANRIINTLRVCDPAVGSGHFLVSALNEFIAIKSELGILADESGKRLRDYNIEVINDELVITDENGNFFEYNPGNKESRRVQETLFREKQIIIENCLFGVDINPNSVKICRLRLWIELLKNAYYKQCKAEGREPGAGGQNGSGQNNELETLPNIDINIKCGNSLISRFPLDADIKTALRAGRWTVDNYREAVMAYRNAGSKEEKRAMEQLIGKIKGEFETEVSKSDKRFIRLNKLKGELVAMSDQTMLFDLPKKGKDEWNRKVKKISDEMQSLESQIEEIRNNRIFENAFEWRFEFPEVLNDEGDFVGFDVVIGNPPYGINFNQIEKQYYFSEYNSNEDIYTIFVEKSIKISSGNGISAFIIPIFWLTGLKFSLTRKLLSTITHLDKGIILPYDIFQEAYIDTGIFIFSKNLFNKSTKVYEFDPRDEIDINILNSLNFSILFKESWINSDDCRLVFNSTSRSILEKADKLNVQVSDVTKSIRGILAKQDDYSNIQLSQEYETIFNGKLDRYYLEKSFQFVKYGNNLKERPNDFSFFEGERLLIRRIVSRQFRVMATLAYSKFVTKKDIYIFKLIDNSIGLKYLLAIINSKLISYLLTKISGSARKDDYTQLTLNDIRQIKIPQTSENEKNKIEDIVTEILFKKEFEICTDTNDLEGKLDQLIYNLYGLTDEEIRIVEEGR